MHGLLAVMDHLIGIRNAGRIQSSNCITLTKLLWVLVAYFRSKLRPFWCLQIRVESLRWAVVAWMPKCELRFPLTTLILTPPKFGDRPLSMIKPSLSKFGELPPLMSSILPKSRDRPPSMSEIHTVMDRGHLSPLIPVRRSLPKPQVRLSSIQRFLLILVVTCLTITKSNGGKFYARAFAFFLLW